MYNVSGAHCLVTGGCSVSSVCLYIFDIEKLTILGSLLCWVASSLRKWHATHWPHETACLVTWSNEPSDNIL
jgi:hypothetical protein